MENMFSMSKKNVLILAIIILLLVIIFLPWSFHGMYLGISINSWLLIGLHFLAPILGIISMKEIK